MHKLFHNKLVINKNGQVRSGWIILAAMAIYYILTYVLSGFFISVLRRILIAKGEINTATGYYSPLVNQLDYVVLPIAMQILTDLLMIAVPVMIWRFIMKHPVSQMGLVSLKAGQKECLTGMLLGFVNCTLIFAMLILSGQAETELKPVVTIVQISWIVAFILVALGEEILNRSFLMSVLRRVRNIYVITIIPSVIFGLIHLANPNVTILSVLNIILAGILFSYMFIKSGNIWMCIGYHFSWNTFQGVIYGIPVSGLDIKGIITTRFPSDTILNGGAFGIEGGILTTIVTILSFLAVKYYYRNSKYDFISDTKEVTDKS